MMDGTPAAAPAARTVNAAGVALIKQFEGLHVTPYMCPGKIWTIGYGHTRTVRAGMRITPDQADQFLNDDLRLVAASIQRLVTVPLNDNQFAALASFAFNIGTANFERSKLLLLLKSRLVCTGARAIPALEPRRQRNLQRPHPPPRRGSAVVERGAKRRNIKDSLSPARGRGKNHCKKLSPS